LQTKANDEELEVTY